MANHSPIAVTRAIREEAQRRLRAMDLEIAALDLVAAADELRAGNVSSPKVARVYQRVRLSLESALAEVA